MRSDEPKPDHPGRMPVVCVRSFFRCAFSQRHKTHRAWTMAALTMFLVLTLMIVLINAQAGFAVFLNGRQIGSARSMEDVTAVVTGAEKQLKEILGRDYSLDSAISVTADLGAKTENTENLQKAILGGIKDVAKLYVLEINGRQIGASSDKRTLDDILSSILSKYTTSATSSVRFTDLVTVGSYYVSKDIPQDPAFIKAMLEPANTQSTCRLTVESTEIRQHTEAVPFETRRYNDSTAYQGSSAVKTKGVSGQNLVTVKTVLVNGVKQISQTIGTETTKEPVTEVVAVGTATRPKTASYGKYIWPTEGVLTSGFGPRTGFGSSNHQGIDIAGHYGENIVAADGGVVIMAGSYYGYGLLVQVRHDNGDITYYGHNSQLIVKEGDRVYQGQPIAHMGSTGDSTGVHCHFEIRQKGTPVNPITLLPR